MTQNEALDILKTGANVFLTGEPGAGKTFTVNQYVSYLRERGVEPAITASTGIAATHIGGMTIHAWSGIGIKKFLTDYDLDRIASNETVVKRIRRTATLIVDEVSMLSPNLLTMVDQVCREVKSRQEPFGGMQVVLVGDFFQLPPVQRFSDNEEAKESGLFGDDLATFAYDSPVWERARFIICYLTEQHRQDDEKYLQLLSAIRHNEFEDEHMELLESRMTDQETDHADVPHLYSHNADVDRINDERLQQIEGNLAVYDMKSEGSPALVAGLKKGCLSPERLTLKKGAKVMFTKNSREQGFVNGTLGEVVDAPSYGTPKIRLQNGDIIYVTPMDWIIEENGSIRAKISQIPLRLAWAITVHKSQGMSLDEAVMDLRQVFEYGQGYVALSRVRRLSGIHLLGWNAKVFQVHPEVLEKDVAFRVSSEDAKNTFAKVDKKELATLHNNFVTASGGKKGISKKMKSVSIKTDKPKSNYLEKTREKYPNAYRPWKAEDEEALKRRFAEEATIKELSKEFGRQSGGIRSRLVKLGLIEEES